MFRDEKITHEDEEEMIRKAAEKIHERGLDLAAILFIQSYKPLAYVGGQMGRFMIFPFLYFLGGDISRSGEKFFNIFEKRENLEKLIMLLEKKAEEKDKKKEKIKKDNIIVEKEVEEPRSKRGWRRFLPF